MAQTPSATPGTPPATPATPGEPEVETEAQKARRGGSRVLLLALGFPCVFFVVPLVLHAWLLFFEKKESGKTQLFNNTTDDQFMERERSTKQGSRVPIKEHLVWLGELSGRRSILQSGQIAKATSVSRAASPQFRRGLAGSEMALARLTLPRRAR